MPSFQVPIEYLLLKYIENDSIEEQNNILRLLYLSYKLIATVEFNAGNDCNAMAEILLSRYDLFITKKSLPISPQTSSEIDDIYGLRVRSRLREMFNLIAFDSQSIDKRV